MGQSGCTWVSAWPGFPTTHSESEKPHRCCCLQDCWGPLGRTRQVLVASPMDGQIRGCSFSPGCTGTRKPMNAWTLWWSECTRLAHGRAAGCFCSHPLPPGSNHILNYPCSQAAPWGWWRSCAAGSKLGVVCAPWMSLQAGNLACPHSVPATGLGQVTLVLPSFPVPTQPLLMLQIPIL